MIKRKTLVTGCFDIIHPGHISLLKEAASYGSVIVGINSDSAIKALKGPDRPVHGEQARETVLRAIRYVDDVFVIHNVKVDAAIEITRPDVWVKGGDYDINTLDPQEVAAAHRVGAKIVMAQYIPGCSTSKILGKTRKM